MCDYVDLGSVVALDLEDRLSRCPTVYFNLQVFSIRNGDRVVRVRDRDV